MASVFNSARCGMRYVVATIALVGMTYAAQAEIMCTERGGCWETGKAIRLINNRQETSVPNRNGKGTMRSTDQTGPPRLPWLTPRRAPRPGRGFHRCCEAGLRASGAS